MKVIFVLIFFLTCIASFDEATGEELAGRTVETVLVRADDLSPVHWPQGEASRVSEIVIPVSYVSDIYRLLLQNYIAPDSEAFTLVYDLNPTLTEANALPPNTTIRLPVIRGYSNRNEKSKKSLLVQLTIDPSIRSQLNQEVDVLQSIAPSIKQLSEATNTQSKIEDLIGWYGQIKIRFLRRTAPPMRQATLNQLLSEAKLLNSIFRAAMREHREITNNERDQVDAIFEDLRLEIVRYGQILASVAPLPQKFYTVIVNIVGVDPLVGKNLRVYYIYNGLFRETPGQPLAASLGFKKLGSGQAENLLMKNYRIWAAIDGRPDDSVTTHYLLQIDDTSPTSFTVDLSLMSGVPRLAELSVTHRQTCTLQIDVNIKKVQGFREPKADGGDKAKQCSVGRWTHSIQRGQATCLIEQIAHFLPV